MIHERSREWPDLGDDSLMCCDSAAIKGVEYCTCWEPVYEAEQQPLIPDSHTGVRARMCGDCAFLPKSPERQGDFAYNNAGEGDLQTIIDSGAAFYCHTGMLRVAEYRHPSGATVPGLAGEYTPEHLDGIPFQTNGTPAFLCAGWAARMKVAE